MDESDGVDEIDEVDVVGVFDVCHELYKVDAIRCKKGTACLYASGPVSQ